MLHEISITPDVFLPQGYDPQELCEACTEGLHNTLFEWCLVRDLRDGDWRKYLREQMNDMPYRTRALWKGLMKSGRLLAYPSELPNAPSNDIEWCKEAVENHNTNACCAGILSSANTKKNFQSNRVVSSIENRSSSKWWSSIEAGHPDGPTSARSLEAYQKRMKPLLYAARSLMFIDPHLNPERQGYSKFLEMIKPALQRETPKPKIEVHRCCYEGSGSTRQIIENQIWETRFRTAWSSELKSHNAEIEVFIWSDAHDRFLLTDLLGVHLGNGFDTSNDVSKTVAWSRMSSSDRDKIQRLYDRDYNSSKLLHRFTIPN